jgi:hypothetical protein
MIEASCGAAPLVASIGPDPNEMTGNPVWILAECANDGAKRLSWRIHPLPLSALICEICG